MGRVESVSITGGTIGESYSYMQRPFEISFYIWIRLWSFLGLKFGVGFVEKNVFMRGNFYKEICYLLFLQL